MGRRVYIKHITACINCPEYDKRNEMCGLSTVAIPISMAERIVDLTCTLPEIFDMKDIVQ